MALPVAPLGQLPNMNMPYSVPTYRKDSALMDALAGFLAGAATNVGSSLGSNLMSRDYAEQPAGFFSKLVSGPKENRQQFEKRLDRMASQAAEERGYQHSRDMSDAERAFRQSLEDRRLGDAQKARALDMYLRQEEFKNRLASQEYDWQMRQQLQSEQDAARLNALREEYSLRNQLPSEQAKLAEIEMTRDIIGRGRDGQTSNNPTNEVSSIPLTPEDQAAIIGPPPADPIEFLDYMRKSGTKQSVIDQVQQMPVTSQSDASVNTSSVPQMPLLPESQGNIPTEVDATVFSDPRSFFGADRDNNLNRARVAEILRMLKETGVEVNNQASLMNLWKSLQYVGDTLIEGYNPQNWPAVKERNQ